MSVIIQHGLDAAESLPRACDGVVHGSDQSQPRGISIYLSFIMHKLSSNTSWLLRTYHQSRHKPRSPVRPSNSSRLQPVTLFRPTRSQVEQLLKIPPPLHRP